MSTDVESTSKAMALDESATTNKVEEKNEGIQNDMSRKIGSK